jgi:hypothetical protein
MSVNVGKEVAALKWMTVGELQHRLAEVFDEGVRTGQWEPRLIR